MNKFPFEIRVSMASSIAMILGLIALLASSSFGIAAEKISVSQALERSQSSDVLLVDIRRPQEWAQSGVAETAFANSMHEDGFLDRLNQKTNGNKNAKIALICATGGRSAWLATELEKRGYTNVLNVSEGMFGSEDGPGWIAKGLPVNRGIPN